ncbi:host-nuclease inhibitor Gam family protein [Selenomonas noxia]|jgi:bacteriophage Mu gam like protein|uniref:host-nuclease inhibitor Gam family protein n=1 Tax=Selenomonas noxia TaxID=135083 RepID=UPI0028D52AE8|nr:host-nuclease inhibitor Gam family protein [Selenomonas noxia]
MSEQIAAYGTEKERFTVTDEASAEWCLEKMEENEKARALIEEQYKRMIARHEKWREEALAELDNSDAYLKGLLLPWAQEKAADGKKKSLKLPSGRIGFRAGSTSYMIGEDKVTATHPKLLAFVKENYAAFIKVEESVRWGDFKKTLHVAKDGQVVTEYGEVIPDMQAVQGEPSFYVEVGS